MSARLDRAAALAAAATAGPWVHNGVNGVHTGIGACVAISHIHEDQRRWDDAAFIAASRTLVPDLVAALREVEGLVEEHAEWEVSDNPWDTRRVCEACEKPWPCDTRTALRAILARFEGES